MNCNKALLFLLSLASFTFSSCAGPKSGTVCTVNCGGGTGSVSLTMVADTLPANPSLLTFRVTVTGIALITSGGKQQALTLNGSPVVDLMRLQSDTFFLGTFANVPAGQYTGVIVSFSNPVLTFFNDTTGTLQGCPSGAVCPQVSIVASGTPQANVTFSVSSTTVAGIGIDLNLSNLLSISGTSLNVNFANTNVLGAFTLPRTGSNLSAGQLDLIEDFTGVVSVSSPAVTITSATATGRGSLTASATASTILNTDPSGTLCKNPTAGNVATCVSSNEAASMDVILKSDGTLSIREIEPLLAALQDTVEGIIVSISTKNVTQFAMIVTDSIPAAQNSLIGTLRIGDGLVVNLATNPGPKPFLVDTKGLSVLPGILGNFAGQTDTTAMHFGQSVAVHVTAFTAASGTTFASSTTDTVTLRWSRLTAKPQTSSSPAFNIVNLPSYFGFTPGSIFTVQTTTGTPGTAGVTNFDGVPDGSSLNSAKPVALRALFLENTSNSANPAFFAAKVRQH
jgi:hypothetical protein